MRLRTRTQQVQTRNREAKRIEDWQGSRSTKIVWTLNKWYNTLQRNLRKTEFHHPIVCTRSKPTPKSLNPGMFLELTMYRVAKWGMWSSRERGEEFEPYLFFVFFWLRTLGFSKFVEIVRIKGQGLALFKLFGVKRLIKDIANTSMSVKKTSNWCWKSALESGHLIFEVGH